MAKKKAKSKSAPSTKRASAKKAKSGPKSSRPKTTKPADPRKRLQVVMASAGVGSRRECELIIEEGRVEIDGQIVTKLGIKVDPAKHTILVDAQELVIEPLQYFILNKPAGVLSTSSDPSGRARVIDLINTDKRVYNVGRLDKASEGLILVTNDGELANRLTHPRYGVEKKYHVQVVGVPAPAELRKLEQGVYLAEGVARATRCKFLKKAKNGCWLELVLDEGRNREIRRMLAKIGHKVRVLKRVAIGPLKLGDLPTGAHRRLFTSELRALRKAASGAIKKRRPRKKPLKPTSKASSDSDSDGKSNKRSKSSGGSKTRKPKRGSAKSSKGRKASAAGSRGAGKGTKTTSRRKPVKKKSTRKSTRGKSAKRKSSSKSGKSRRR